MQVKVKDVLRGRLEPVILPETSPSVPLLEGEGRVLSTNGHPILAARPVSDSYQEAVMCVIRDSMPELGLTEDDIGLNKEEQDESAAKVDKVLAKITFKDIVARTKFANRLDNVKILELIVVSESGEPAFDTIEEVRMLPGDVKRAMLAAIKTQEGRSAQLGESKRGD